MGRNIRVRSLTLPALAIAGFALAGCTSSGPQLGGDYTQRHHGGIRYQIQPYQVNGVWYYPKADYAYDETGTASWYGSQFQGRATSDGEIFDMNEVSAAHKTLPLPSVVEVTNLQNGRSLQMRVNDRGPFVDGRIIDLSRRAAQLLGYEGAGTTQVRVRILKDESIQVAEAAMRGQAPRTMIAQIPAATQTRALSYSQPAPVLRPAPMAPPARQTDMPASMIAPVVVASTPRPNPSAATPIQETRMAEAPMAAEVYAAPAAPPPRSHERFAAAAPPSVEPRNEPPPARMASQAPQRRWPSLISEAHADTLHLPLASAPVPAHKPVFAVASSGSRIFVQAGAFAIPENAQRARAQIAALGSVEVVPTSSSHGAPLYKVRLGPVGSEAEAARLLSRLSASGYPGARVIGE
ncbi:MAG: septal ring lytic transglycosylase RlpA family protein [Alphaproteobacteria bacterium]|nr:septal ring lytic transglycosylase RlpA family protein [Alphaproteobacteria bacterium]